MLIKVEGMTQFDIFHVFAENSVNSVICFFWALLQAAKKKFIKKCPCSSNLKTKFYWTQIFFDPSLERSWCEYFELCYGLSPYHLPPSSPGVLLEPPYLVISKNKILASVPSIYT